MCFKLLSVAVHSDVQISSGHFFFLHTEETPVKGLRKPVSLLQVSLPHHDFHFDLKNTASCCRFREVLCR